MWWWVVPVLCVGVLALAVRDLPGAWSAGRGNGVHGTFVVVRQDCARTCSTLGDFTSDDRGTKRRLFHAEAPSGLHPGDSIRAVMSGDSAYRERTSLSWLLIAGVAAVFALILGMWLLALYLRLTTPRTPTGVTR